MATTKRRESVSRRQKGLKLTQDAIDRIEWAAYRQKLNYSQIVEKLVLLHLPPVDMGRPESARAG